MADPSPPQHYPGPQGDRPIEYPDEVPPYGGGLLIDPYVFALMLKVGADNSTDPYSLDYQVQHGGGGGGVEAFNTRTGFVTLESADIEGLFGAAGQLFYGTGSGTGALLSVGTTGQVLTVGAGGALQWSTPSAGGVTSVNTRTGAVTIVAGDIEATFNAKGDIFLGTGSGTGTILPIGTTGQVPTVTAGGTLAYATPASAPVTSVFTRTGAVTAQTGDYTVAQVTGAAPLASPALTGTPTAPTATALTDNTQIATTAYADAAVAAEALQLMNKLTVTAIKTSAYNINANEMMRADASGGSFAANLPNAPADATLAGAVCVAAPGANILTINAQGSDTILTTVATSATLKINGELKLWQYTAATKVWTPLSQIPLASLLAYIMTAANIEATFTAANQVYLGTGSGTGALAVLANGYGIAGFAANPPTPAVSLTSVASALGMNTTLTNSLATLLSPSLAVGKWLVIAVLGAQQTAGAGAGTAPAPIQELNVGTATATIAGGNAVASTSIDTGSVAGQVYSSSTMIAIVTVTVTGTILMQALTQNTSGTTIAQATTTGIVAVRIA